MAGIDRREAAAPDEGERLLRFPHLDVAILDGVVYTTTGGLLPLGPLAGAVAACWRLPPYHDGTLGTVTARSMIIVVSGASSHRLAIEHTPSAGTSRHADVRASRQIEKQVAGFNLLAMRARPAAASAGYPGPVACPPVIDADAG